MTDNVTSTETPTIPLVADPKELWRVQHWTITSTLIFIGLCISWCILPLRPSDPIASTVITMGFTCGSAIIGALLGVKAWTAIKLGS